MVEVVKVMVGVVTCRRKVEVVKVMAVEAVVLMVGLLEVVELVLVVVVLHQGLVHFLLALVQLV